MTRASASAAPRFAGDDATIYEIAYQVCGAFSQNKIASDLGISSTNPVDLAQKYSEDYRPAFHQAPFEGCLGALLGRPAKV